MHPNIVSDKPGVCPICGMRLERVEAGKAESLQKNKGEQKILFYRHPMRPDVTSPVQAKDEMGMDYVPVREREETGGRSSVEGHAEIQISPEKQQRIGVKTEKVEKRPLAVTIRAAGRAAYDPELYTFLSEYREARAAREKILKSPLPEVHERADALVSSAELKLKRFGLTAEQAAGLSKNSESGERLLLPSETAWIYAEIYEYETDLVRPGAKAVVTTPALPGKKFEGTVEAVDPVLNAASRTLKVRIQVPATKSVFKPEMFVDVVIEISIGEKLAIPSEALMDSGAAQYVFVDHGEGRFEPRKVVAGRETGGYYEILEGLSEGETVVTSANFLIDSESRLQSAVKSFGGGVHQH